VIPGDRVGLVTFAGSATKSCPLTNNYGAFRLALDDVTTRSTARGGTNLGDAIRFAADDCFTDEVRDHKAIILITDGGETEESYAKEASQLAFEERGIRVFTVGLGELGEGARIPITRNGQRTYLQFEDQVIWSKLDPALLQSMAAVADGGYFHNTDFREIYDDVQRKVLDRTFETEQREMQHARFHWFAWPAFVLLMLESLLTDRKAGSA
jgi:Ca-activated chloride channel family protein